MDYAEELFQIYAPHKDKRDALIDAHAALCIAEIKQMAKDALREIKRKADFPNRSAGQRRRHNAKQA